MLLKLKKKDAFRQGELLLAVCKTSSGVHATPHQRTFGKHPTATPRSNICMTRGQTVGHKEWIGLSCKKRKTCCLLGLEENIMSDNYHSRT